MTLFRPTVRLKLTMAYGGLFLLAGAILLTLNYALVRTSDYLDAVLSRFLFSRMSKKTSAARR